VNNINPFELHPLAPNLKRALGECKITISQLEEAVDTVAGRVATSPDKTWGFKREEIREWLQEVVVEASKYVID